MSYNSFRNITFGKGSSVCHVSSDGDMNRQMDWSVTNKESSCEVNGTTELEKIKEQARGFNRKLEDLRMQLVEMRVDTCSVLGSSGIDKEIELSEEMEALKEEVENND